MVRLPDRNDLRTTDPQPGPSADYSGLATSAYYLGQEFRQTGAAISRAGARLGEVFHKAEMEQADYNARVGLLQFEEESSRIFREAQKRMPVGGDGFAGAILANYDNRAAEFLERLPAPLRAQYEERLIRRRLQEEDAATRTEAAEFTRYQDGRLGDGLDRLRERAFGSPTSVAEFQREGEALIDGAPHLSPAERDERRRAWRQRVQTDAAGRLVEQDPATAAALLNGRRPSIELAGHVPQSEYEGVDPKLRHIIAETARRVGVRVQMISGKEHRPRGGLHPTGLAMDVFLLDEDGKPIPAGAGGTNPNGVLAPKNAAAGFASYQMFAHAARMVQQELYPELDNAFRWGGYFGDGRGNPGSPNDYGALDTIQFDLGGARGLGMAGGSWDRGLSPEQERLWREAGIEINRTPGLPQGRASGASGFPDVRLAELSILDRSDPDFHYGIDATAAAQHFRGIVLHHDNANADALVAYGQRVDETRDVPGAYGYHFVIARDGTINLAAPLDKRTNHIKGPDTPQRQAAFGLSNANAIGVVLAEGAGGASPEQMQALQQLIPALANEFGIDPANIVGHGEIQGDRMATEGELARMFREEGAADTRFADIPFEQRRELRRSAERGVAARQAEIEKVTDARKAEVRNLMESDIASRRASGLGVDGLDEAAVLDALGPAKAAEYTRRRAVAEALYDFEDGLWELSPAEIEQRYRGMEPRPGTPGYAAQQEAYEQAKEIAGAAILRFSTDPAAAVERAPAVQEAMQGGDLARLLEVRLATQERIGVPEPLRQPLTNAEAKRAAADMVARVIGGGVVGPGFADHVETVFAEVYAAAQEQYGHMAEHAMRQVVEGVADVGTREDRAQRQIVTRVMMQMLQSGLTPEEIRAAQQEIQEAEQDAAMEGRAPPRRTTAPAAEPFRLPPGPGVTRLMPWTQSLPGPLRRMFSGELSEAEVAYARRDMAQDPGVIEFAEEALIDLRKAPTPEDRQFFDQLFGEGASDVGLRPDVTPQAFVAWLREASAQAAAEAEPRPAPTGLTGAAARRAARERRAGQQ